MHAGKRGLRKAAPLWVDPLEHLRWNDLIEGAQVLAVFAYTVAELPEQLPRMQAKPEGKK